MDAIEQTKFRTKTGSVFVSADLLRIERSGFRGRQAERLQGNSTRRTWVVYGVLVVLLGWQSWTLMQSSQTVPAVLMAALALYIVAALGRSRNFTMSPLIKRPDVSRVECINGISGLTRDRLVVHLLENGQPRRRFLLMPGVLQKGKGEIEHARALLLAAGWPVDA